MGVCLFWLLLFFLRWGRDEGEEAEIEIVLFKGVSLNTSPPHTRGRLPRASSRS